MTETPEVATAVDIRRADYNLQAFADHVVELLLAETPMLVDLAQLEDQGNRITLRAWPQPDPS